MLKRPIDLVQIKDLRIKLAAYSFQHLFVLGVLRIVNRFQESCIAPDATTIQPL
jgi:hypothetical protein